MAEDNGAGYLEDAARILRPELLEVFDGDVTAAQDALRQIASEPDVMCFWATRMLRRDDPDAEPFSWDEIPTSMKPAAIAGMAAAYLIATSKEKR